MVTGRKMMSAEAAHYALTRCPRCESRGCAMLQCKRNAPVRSCPSPTGHHEHSICLLCGFERISAGEVPPALRAPTQMEISIEDAFEFIVGRGRGKLTSFGLTTLSPWRRIGSARECPQTITHGQRVEEVR